MARRDRTEPSTEVEDTPQAVVAAPEEREAEGGGSRPENMVPGWLALLVLVLLLAVTALGGFIVRGLLTGDGDAATPQEIAVSQWERTVDQNPSDIEGRLSLGYAYQQEGRYEDALAEYATVIEADPQNTAAMYNSGISLMHLDRFDEAEAQLWDVLEIAPDHALAAKALGEYYIAKEQYKSALTALEPVIEARPQFADLQYLAGSACEKLGLLPQAIEYYRGTLEYAPDLVEARDALARLGASEETP